MGNRLQKSLLRTHKDKLIELYYKGYKKHEITEIISKQLGMKFDRRRVGEVVDEIFEEDAFRDDTAQELKDFNT